MVNRSDALYTNDKKSSPQAQAGTTDDFHVESTDWLIIRIVQCIQFADWSLLCQLLR